MSKSIKTSKGNELPLMSLKGKDYLQVAYRLQWLADDVESYEIQTQFLSLTGEETVAQATVTLFNKEGKVVRKATATKRETKKDFPDHTEKAETGASGRALAMLGFGTQHAVADLDEGARIVDSPLPVQAKVTVTSSAPAPTVITSPQPNPVVVVQSATTAAPAAPSQAVPSSGVQAGAKRSSFKQPSKAARVEGGGF